MKTLCISLIISLLVASFPSIPLETMSVEMEVKEPVFEMDIPVGVEPLIPIGDIKATIEEEIVEEPVEEVVEEPTYISMGFSHITAYCSCKKCCGKWALNRPKDENGNEIVYGSSGEVLIPGYSVAVDPDVIPYGTKIYINGQEYIAHDSGSAIDGNDIDVYFTEHQEAWDFAAQFWNVPTEIFILVED